MAFNLALTGGSQAGGERLRNRRKAGPSPARAERLGRLQTQPRREATHTGATALGELPALQSVHTPPSDGTGGQLLAPMPVLPFVGLWQPSSARALAIVNRKRAFAKRRRPTEGAERKASRRSLACVWNRHVSKHSRSGSPAGSPRGGRFPPGSPPGAGLEHAGLPGGRARAGQGAPAPGTGLAQHLASVEVAPWAERVAQALLQAAGSDGRLPTPLTQANRMIPEAIAAWVPVPHLPAETSSPSTRTGMILVAETPPQATPARPVLLLLSAATVPATCVP